MKINPKIKNFKKILLASLLLTALFSFFYSCKKTPTTPELPSSGSIQVDSTPTNAAIWLDNEDTGEKTPALLANISLGSHTIKLTKNCYQHFETEVTVEKSQTVIVNAELEKAIPILIYPEEGAVMDNGRSDGRDDIIWWFDWSDVVGATKYNILIFKPGPIVMIDKEREASGASFSICCGCFQGSALFNWKWKVRAFIDDRWCGWSEVRRFDVEPCNTDPPS